ncbi:membrane protein [Cloacibacterium rupense]|uniref:Membrane protein n=1 Tax=Cloacibacterium rupense TaxID=517423 RepID=A0ABQ2NFT6_9FLAO|nr:TIGR00341 family protein [Cloacibacterium rupense]GGP02278.1 membrane protein [Cloacibacterium rupense]
MNKFFDLHKGEEDKRAVLENVRSNISFTGSNLWILMAAVFIASIGLNVNSTAVIIGAMLISPLMGPIVGAGFALGIFDFHLLRKSLKNLLIATIASLLVSSIYFLLSPFKEAQSELLARTSPNIYDVLIAFFGGLVGVIAITRVEKGNPIPGVAIATALMPPLCTAGYGLATGNLKFFFGALFLYTINCVFIGISTFIIVKFLKYPPVNFVDKKEEKRVQNIVTIVSVLILIPSVYFAYSLYQEQKFRLSVNEFLEKEIVDKGHTLIYKKVSFSTNPKKIELALLSKNYSQDEVDMLNKKLNDFGIENTNIEIKKSASDDTSLLKDDLLNEVSKSDEKDKKIIELEQELSKNIFDNTQLLKESKILFPNINAITVSNNNFAQGDSLVKKTILIYKAETPLSEEDELQFKNWIQQRLNIKNVEVFK